MSQSVTTNAQGNTIMINVKGRFDFGLHSEFRKAYVEKVSSGTVVVIDLKAVDYMDSSALGMLLLLREYAGNDAADVKIVNAGGDVGEILKVANFEKLFKLG